MKRSAIILVVLGVLLLACTSDDATPTATSAVSGMSGASPTVEAASTGGGTPAWVRPEPTVGPEWEPRALLEGETGLVWESFVPEPTEDGGWGQYGTRLYDRRLYEFWHLRGPDGEPYYLVLSPKHDVALASAVEAEAPPDAPTVLIDLASGEMRPLTAFPLSGVGRGKGWIAHCWDYPDSHLGLAASRARAVGGGPVRDRSRCGRGPPVAARYGCVPSAARRSRA
jgi:hypothetical protein